MQNSVLVLVALTLANFALRSDWAACAAFVSTTTLLGLVLFIERSKNETTTHIQDQIKSLKNQIDNINLARGIGR